MVSMLRMEVEHVAGKACVRCDGELLWGGGLERLLEIANTISADSVVIDLSQVNRIDAHGVGVLVCFAKRLGERGMRLTVENIRPNIRFVLQTCGLSAMLHGPANWRSSAA